MGEIFLVPNSGLFRWDRILNLDQGVGACFLGFFFHYNSYKVCLNSMVSFML